jgi:hypothetical protein
VRALAGLEGIVEVEGAGIPCTYRGVTVTVPGRALFGMSRAVPDTVLSQYNSDFLPVLLDWSRYFDESLAPSFLGPSATVSSVESLTPDAVLSASRPTSASASSSPLAFLAVSKSVLAGLVATAATEFVRKHKEALDQELLPACQSISVAELSGEETIWEYKMGEERKILHPLLLDEASMPQFSSEGRVLRDETKAPFMQQDVVVTGKKTIPSTRHWRELSRAELLTRIPCFHLTVLRQRVDRYHSLLRAAAGAQFNVLSRDEMMKLVAHFEKPLADGFTVSLAQKAERAAEYRLVPAHAGARQCISTLKEKLRQQMTDTNEFVKKFRISNRPAIAPELTQYVRLLNFSSLTASAKFARLCQAQLCVVALADEPGYHVMLDEANEQIIADISSVLAAVGEKVRELEQSIEHSTSPGSVLVMFPCHKHHIGFFILTSERSSDGVGWTRWLRYNTQACAAVEYQRLCGMAVPAEVEPGVRIEAIFSAGSSRNVALTMSADVITATREQMNSQALAKIQSGEYTNESNLPVPLNLGRIVWFKQEGGVHHLKCEASDVLSSPRCALEFHGGVLKMVIDTEEMLATLARIVESAGLTAF